MAEIHQSYGLGGWSGGAIMMLLNWKAKVVGGELKMLPSTFQHGDTLGKSGSAIADANEQMTKTDGVRQKLYALQEAAATLPEVDCPLQHSFIDGVYVRTIFIPAGTVIVGKIHKHSHANILSKGEVVVMTEDGGREHLAGPMTMVSPAGCKRAVYAVTDSTWTTIHQTDETDLAKIEDWVIAKDYAEYEQFKLQRDEMKQIDMAAAGETPTVQV